MNNPLSVLLILYVQVTEWPESYEIEPPFFQLDPTELGLSPDCALQKWLESCQTVGEYRQALTQVIRMLQGVEPFTPAGQLGVEMRFLRLIQPPYYENPCEILRQWIFQVSQMPVISLTEWEKCPLGQSAKRAWFQIRQMNRTATGIEYKGREALPAARAFLGLPDLEDSVGLEAYLFSLATYDYDDETEELKLQVIERLTWVFQVILSQVQAAEREELFQMDSNFWQQIFYDLGWLRHLATTFKP